MKVIIFLLFCQFIGISKMETTQQDSSKMEHTTLQDTVAVDTNYQQLLVEIDEWQLKADSIRTKLTLIQQKLAEE